ncbi:MAG: metallophosphoesterase [Deltaproteobacteria bacterium]|nr:metallophosphoesterase [Deltaproteobacteria bacterium]
MNTQQISALKPHGDGHQFVFYGDCASGIPGQLWGRNFAQVNNVLQRLYPEPEFIVFLGDHILGSFAETHAEPLGIEKQWWDIKKQWHHWLNKEMDWLDSNRVPVYHVTSNHDTYDEASERVWREVFPGIPHNGPPDQKGLSYWVRRGDLLLVVVNTNFSGLGGNGHVECSWLDSTLTAQADARYKIVAGHVPAFPVNGYDERPRWCIAKGEAEDFWSVLTRHRVIAYLCSHIIAFDVQEHQGVLQVCSGGAGTNFGPGGTGEGQFMGEGEYHHFVQAALDENEFRLQTVDKDGCVRERFTLKNYHAVGGQFERLDR